VPEEKMLVGGEKFRVSGVRIGGLCSDGNGNVDIEGDGRETDFVAAGLVAKLEGNVLCT